MEFVNKKFQGIGIKHVSKSKNKIFTKFFNEHCIVVVIVFYFNGFFFFAVYTLHTKQWRLKKWVANKVVEFFSFASFAFFRLSFYCHLYLLLRNIRHNRNRKEESFKVFNCSVKLLSGAQFCTKYIQRDHFVAMFKPLGCSGSGSGSGSGNNQVFMRCGNAFCLQKLQYIHVVNSYKYLYKCDCLRFWGSGWSGLLCGLLIVMQYFQRISFP